MENSAYALKIAGAILIALLLIAILVWGLGMIQTVPKSQEKTKKQEEIVKFNLQYEAYTGKEIYGVDVVSVINKALDNNLKYENQEGYKIDIIWEYDKPDGFRRAKRAINTDQLSISNSKGVLIDDKINEGASSEFEVSKYRNVKYKCTSIEYDNKDGRVSAMEFTYVD